MTKEVSNTWGFNLEACEREKDIQATNIYAPEGIKKESADRNEDSCNKQNGENGDIATIHAFID